MNDLVACTFLGGIIRRKALLQLRRADGTRRPLNEAMVRTAAQQALAYPVCLSYSSLRIERLIWDIIGPPI